jgi:hypothetical protein
MEQRDPRMKMTSYAGGVSSHIGAACRKVGWKKDFG